MFKNQILAVIFSIFALQTAALAQESPTPDPQTKEKVFTFVERKPEFPGGEKALMEFISRHTEYPKIARVNGIEGKVFVQFIIEKDGSLTNVVVLRGIGGGCDAEAVRVLQSSPKWSPGKQNGQKVRVKYTLPFLFKLDEAKPKKGVKEK